MAKSVAEWKKSFEDLYVAMCEDLDVNPDATSVEISTSHVIEGYFDPIDFKVRTTIRFD